MARKASAKGSARKASARKRNGGGATAYQKRLREYQRTHPAWASDPNWKQKARGHKAKEHVTRHQRWRDRALAFAERQAMRFPGDAARMAEQNFAAIDARRKRYGEGDLARLEDVVRRLEARRAGKPKDDRSRPEPLSPADFRHAGTRSTIDMDTLADSFDVPLTVFGYH